MDNAFIPPIPPELRAKVAAEASRSVQPLLDDLVARSLPSAEGRVISALYRVKQSHGRARRVALRELDRVVIDLFRPVEGAPLPSAELYGKPDVLPGAFVGVDYGGETYTSGLVLFPNGYVPFYPKYSEL